MTKKEKPVQVRLSPELYNKCAEQANKVDGKLSQVIRKWIEEGKPFGLYSDAEIKKTQ